MSKFDWAKLIVGAITLGFGIWNNNNLVSAIGGVIVTISGIIVDLSNGISLKPKLTPRKKRKRS